MSIIDYVLYSDTDSLYINLGRFLDDNIGTEWRSMPDDRIIYYIIKLSTEIEKVINDRIYRVYQRRIYNSNITDFRIIFEQETIAKSILFVKKKKYTMWCVNDGGVNIDEIKTTGLEFVRSDTPEAVRPRLKKVMEMILKGEEDKKISETISLFKDEIKKEVKEYGPERIAMNIGAKNIEKYVKNNIAVKGTPWHVKGIANYRMLLRELDIENKYEDISNGNKVKVAYVKKNPFGVDVISFMEWPKEFNKILQIDYDKMINNFFTGKIEILLEPMKKLELLNNSKDDMDMFF